MVEQGLVSLVQTGIASACPTCPGGFGTQLPPDVLANLQAGTVTQAWTWQTIARIPTYTLTGQAGLTTWVVSIDCHGTTSADALNLARAINNVVRGSWSGMLPSDPDNTIVQGIFSTGNEVSGYDKINYSYVTTVGYRIQYNQR